MRLVKFKHYNKHRAFIAQVDSDDKIIPGSVVLTTDWDVTELHPEYWAVGVSIDDLPFGDFHEIMLDMADEPFYRKQSTV